MCNLCVCVEAVLNRVYQTRPSQNVNRPFAKQSRFTKGNRVRSMAFAQENDGKGNRERPVRVWTASFPKLIAFSRRRRRRRRHISDDSGASGRTCAAGTRRSRDTIRSDNDYTSPVGNERRRDVRESNCNYWSAFSLFFSPFVTRV